MEPNEIKMEVGIQDMKKEYRRLEDRVSAKKTEIASLVTVRESVERDVEALRDELTEITNQIAKKQLAWAEEKQEKLKEIEDKFAEANEILKKRDELEVIKHDTEALVAKNASILNEKRGILLDIDREKTTLSSKKKEIDDKLSEIQVKEFDIIKRDAEFRERLKKLVEEYV